MAINSGSAGVSQNHGQLQDERPPTPCQRLWRCIHARHKALTTELRRVSQVPIAMGETPADTPPPAGDASSPCGDDALPTASGAPSLSPSSTQSGASSHCATPTTGIIDGEDWWPAPGTTAAAAAAASCLASGVGADRWVRLRNDAEGSPCDPQPGCAEPRDETRHRDERWAFWMFEAVAASSWS